MMRFSGRFWTLAAGFWGLAGCAGSPAAPEEANEPAPVVEEAGEEPAGLAYHERSELERLGREASRAIAPVVCGAGPAARACRRALSRGVKGYAGAFSAAGVSELVAAVDGGAVLLRLAAEGPEMVDRLEEVDVSACRVVGGAQQRLVCRVPEAVEGGFTVGLRQVRVEGARLVAEALALPRLEAPRTVFFAGWREAGGRLEVRVHDIARLAQTLTIDMAGAGGCRHRAFALSDGGFQELDGCTTQQYEDHGAAEMAVYASQLDEPLLARRRAIGACYADEARRLEEAGGEALGAGEVQVRMLIGSPGAVVSCEVVADSLQNDAVSRCVCRKLVQTSFPPVPAEGTFEVGYPFAFEP